MDVIHVNGNRILVLGANAFAMQMLIDRLMNKGMDVVIGQDRPKADEFIEISAYHHSDMNDAFMIAAAADVAKDHPPMYPNLNAVPRHGVRNDGRVVPAQHLHYGARVHARLYPKF